MCHEAGIEHKVEFRRGLQIGTCSNNLVSEKENACYFQPADLHIKIKAIIIK